MAEPLLAGIDAGTTRIRVLIFAPDGRILAEGSASTPTTTPRPGWAEHDAEALWQATAAAARAATGQLAAPGRIVGVAAASVGEALVTLDRDGRPTGPIIAWYDERPQAELARLFAEVGKGALHRLTGLSADLTFSLLKLMWLKANRPDAMAHTARWLNVTHYLAWRLCGVPGCDFSQASRSLAFDLERKRWADELIAAQDLDPAGFAELRPLGTRLGGITAEAAAATGLPAGCAVGVGGHDHVLGALAAGALQPGVVLNSLGTAEAVTLALPAPQLDPELGRRGYNQGVVALPDRAIHYIFGGTPACGAAVEWFRALFAESLSHDALIAAGEGVPPGCHGVSFLPDLRGRLAPVPDPLARGAWFGLAGDSSRAQLYRAVLEGLAMETRQTVDALAALPGLPAIETIKAISGGTRNRLLLQIKASVHGRALLAAEMAEATALGAALLGGLAAGLWPDLASALAGVALPFRRIEPVAAWTRHYDALYREVYQPAYAALAPLHHAAQRLAAAP
jgi:xylulokinase